MLFPYLKTRALRKKDGVFIPLLAVFSRGFFWRKYQLKIVRFFVIMEL